MKKPNSEIRPPRLHTVVAEHIRKAYVATASPGDRLPSEAELAATYSVSVPTVREALRSLSQAGLVDRRQGSGTYCIEAPKVRAPAAGDGKCVAIVCPYDLTHGGLSCYFVQVALHAGKCLKARGISSQIYYGEEGPSETPRLDDTYLCKDIREGRIQGVISTWDHSKSAYKALVKELGIPFIDSGDCRNSKGEPLMDNFMDEAVSYLIEHRKRKLACIGFGQPMGKSSSSRFRELVEQRGGITDEAWILGDLHPNRAGAGYSLMRELWSRSSIKPDGLVLCDDVFFQDIALAITELKISVPSNFMIVSHVNPGVRFVAPFQVVRFEMDSIEFARQLAARMSDRLAGADVDLSSSFTMNYTLKDPFAEPAVAADDEHSLPHHHKLAGS